MSFRVFIWQRLYKGFGLADYKQLKDLYLFVYNQHNIGMVWNLLSKYRLYMRPWFDMMSCRYRKSPCGGQMILRLSFLHNRISRTCKMASLLVKYPPGGYHCTFAVTGIGGLVQERRNSIADVLELNISCTTPSICNKWQYACPK